MNRTKYSRRKRATGLRLLCAAIIFGFGCNVVMAQSAGSNEGGTVPQPVPEFPAFNWWNTDITSAPVDPNSANYIKFVNNGSPRALHPDFGGNASGANGIYGFPYVVVDGVTGTGKSPPPLQTVNCHYSTQCDGVNHTTNTAFPFYPIPAEAITTPRWIECGDPGNVDDRSKCDRHLLVIDRDHKYLYELWNVWYDTATAQWDAGSGAFFDMTKSARRPSGWTSADAAGLAIFPGLVRYDEVYNAYGTNTPSINHAFRVTVRSSNGFVYPASHKAGAATGALPMGARLRLKASFDITGFSAPMQKIFQAMKTYGLIVADNGSDMYISGTYDTSWDNGVLNPAFGKLTASDFDVVELGWKPPLYEVAIAPAEVVGGTSATGTITLTDVAPTGGATVDLSTGSELTVPASVVVPSGVKTVKFTIGSAAVTTVQKPTIVGTYSGSKYTAGITVEPAPVLTALALNPTSITGVGTSTGTVTLDEAALAPGVVVTLSSSNTAAATVLKTIKVTATNTTASFNVTSKKVAATSTATISATYSGVTRTAVVTVNPSN